MKPHETFIFLIRVLTLMIDMQVSCYRMTGRNGTSFSFRAELSAHSLRLRDSDETPSDWEVTQGSSHGKCGYLGIFS